MHSTMRSLLVAAIAFASVSQTNACSDQSACEGIKQLEFLGFDCFSNVMAVADSIGQKEKVAGVVGPDDQIRDYCPVHCGACTKTAKGSMTVAIDFPSLKAKYPNFDTDFAKELAEMINMDPTSVAVTGKKAGSVVVDLEIKHVPRKKGSAFSSSYPLKAMDNLKKNVDKIAGYKKSKCTTLPVSPCAVKFAGSRYDKPIMKMATGMVVNRPPTTEPAMSIATFIVLVLLGIILFIVCLCVACCFCCKCCCFKKKDNAIKVMAAEP